MMNKKTSIAVVILIALLSSAHVWSAGLDARTNSTKIAQGDTFQLTLTAGGSATSAPDLAPLSQNFDVLDTSRSSQTQMVNGRVSQSYSWVVTLSPLGEGTVTIPSLNAGSLSSDPLSIEVVDASELPKLQGATDVALTTSISGDSHYRFQEIPLTVRIESRQVLQSAQLIPPKGDFELSRTGQERQSQINRGGERVNVIEQSYTLRPQVEGKLEIPPFTLKGTVQDSDVSNRGRFGSARSDDPFARMEQMMAQLGSGSMFSQRMNAQMGSLFAGMGSAGIPFVARSEALDLNVLTNPAGDSSSWFLPAKAVVVQGEWLAENPTFREGEAVSRKVSVIALGARSEQLPDLQFEAPDGARIYIDDVQTDTANTAEGTVARRDFLISIVPTRSGDVVLPEISVEWMNTVTDEAQVATLATETISVEAAKGPGAGSSSESAAVGNPAVTTMASGIGEQSGWLNGLVVFAIVSSLVLAGFLIRRQTNPLGKNAKTTYGPDLSVASKDAGEKASDLPVRLRQAARCADTGAFYKALLDLNNHPSGFDAKAINRAIAVMEHSSYGKKPDDSGLDLESLLNELLQSKVSFRHGVGSTRQLPPLYPQMTHGA